MLGKHPEPKLLHMEVAAFLFERLLSTDMVKTAPSRLYKLALHYPLPNVIQTLPQSGANVRGCKQSLRHFASTRLGYPKIASMLLRNGASPGVGHARRRSRRHQPASRSRLRLESFHVLRRCLMPNPIAYTAGSCALSSVLSPLYRNSGAWRRTCSPRKGRWPDPMS